MSVYTNEELLEQLRAIGWTEEDISEHYPHLLPGYAPWSPPATTLWERLISVGWTEEEIRSTYPDIVPESEGGILEVPGEPESTEGLPPPGTEEPPPANGELPLGNGDITVPPVGGDHQTADLFTLGLLFL